MTADHLTIAKIKEKSQVPRARNPHGFEVFECWGEFLDTGNENAEHMFGLISGVRLMIKFDEWVNRPQMVEKVMQKAELAASMGKKIHLVIDCFNTATGPNDYHRSVEMPSLNKIPKMVGEIIRNFPKLAMLEVFNEPNHCKNKSQEFTIKSYVPYVVAFGDGAAIGNTKAKLVATQSNKTKWSKQHADNKIENGWEWRTDCMWDSGNLEGKHSAVLHEHTDTQSLIHGISSTWHDGIAIGWRHPIYESELSPVGKKISTNSGQGYNMTAGMISFAKTKNLPICLLTWGGMFDGFGNPKWPGEMHYVNKNGKFSTGAKAIYDFYHAQMPKEPDDDDGVIIIDPGEEPPSVEEKGYTARVRRNMKKMTREQRKLLWEVSEEFVE
jgi:hypothetical protein